MINIKEVIEIHLKKLKLNFNYECINNDHDFIIYIGSIELNLFIETKLNLPVVIQMVIRLDSDSDDIHTEIYDNFDGITQYEIISKIDEYIELTKRTIKINAKIENIFEKINELINNNDDLELKLLIENHYNNLNL